jgi:osmotically-inducible protein OsmY
MQKNEDLQQEVHDAIKWEPILNASEIGVSARDGVVTLTGTVDSYAKKFEAENAAKSIAGVRAVVEKIKVGDTYQRDDNDIADEILDAFESNWEIPNEKVRVKVENGWVMLTGELQWNYQKEAVNVTVKNIFGVKGVINHIKVDFGVQDEIEKKRDIERAFARTWSINNENIEVEILGNDVVLRGTVYSWYQKDEAARIAWNTQGIRSVNNELVILQTSSVLED